MASKRYENWKKGLVRKVKWAQRNRGMSDDEYRTMLFDRYQVESSTKLSVQDLEDLISHFEKNLSVEFYDSGRRSKKKNPNFYEIPDHVPHARQKRKIAAMWCALGYKMSGLNTRAKSQGDVDSFLWVKSQSFLQKLGRDLTSRCQKKGIDPSPERRGA